LKTNVLCLSARNRRNCFEEKLAKYNKNAARSGCTGQCPVRQAGSGELAALGTSTAAYGYKSPDCVVVHRTVRRANCQPGQRSAAESARDAWQEPTVRWGTGLSGVHRTVSGAPMAPKRQRSASPKKERNPHRTVRCARRQKARIAFLDCSQRLLAALGL
jgi:hypothetical protein